MVLRPLPGFDLSQILHSIKSYTAKQANRLLQREGDFWQSEYFDRLIRDDEELMQQVDYVFENPAKASLENWPWRGRDDDAIADVRGLVTSTEHV